MEKDERLIEALWWEKLTEGQTRSCSDGQGCGPFLLFDLRLNYGGGNEDNGHLLQMVLFTLIVRAPNHAAGHC